MKSTRDALLARHERPPSRTKLLATFLAIALVASACVRTTDVGGVGGNRPITAGALATALTLFDSCDDYLEYARAEALKRVTAYGLEGYGHFGPVFEDFAVEEAMEAEVAASDGAGDSAARSSGGDFSQSNVQVAGIDEPDLVKTDGERIFVLANGSFYLLNTQGDLLGKEQLDFWSESMFIYQDRVVIFGSDYQYGPRGIGSPITQVMMLDVSDPDDIDTMETLKVDGSQVSARLIDDQMRLVVSALPLGFEWAYPEGSGLRAEGAALEANQKLIEESTVDNWLPYFIHDGADGQSEGVLVPCENAFHPEEFSGFELLSIVTLNLSDGLIPVTSTGLMAGGSTLYASGDSMFIAQQRWIDWSEEDPDIDGITTDIHAFDTSSEVVTYRASGTVPGFLLNQFAMDEYNGDLRVASTRTPEWFGFGGQSDSVVSVLRESGGTLEVIGSVEGLGVTEQIRSVRFIGPLGYVVTFRQTDPLYVVDLTDPTLPEVKGELKINGYSAYLHPFGEDQIVGIGQDATDQGRTLGLQISLFDVSDSTDPIRSDALSLANAYTEAEWNHLAVTAWRDRFFIPFERWGEPEAFIEDSDEPYIFDFEAGLLVVEIAGDGIRELGRISHPSSYWCWDEQTGEQVEFGSERADFCEPDYGGQIRRALVIGDQVFTVSSRGVQSNDYTTLSTGVFTPFE